MQPIERYGVLALLFLVIAVAAVVFYDKKKHKTVPEVAPAASSVESLDPDRPAWDPSVLPLTGPVAEGELAGTAVLDPITGLPVGGALIQPAPTAIEPTLAPAGSVIAAPATFGSPILVSGPRDYTIKKGDTPSGIAARELGSSGRVSEILALNPGLDPKRLQIGQLIKLPMAGSSTSTAALAALPSGAATSVPAGGRSYVVRSGDSFWSIAASQLGDGNRHGEISALNPGIDAKKLKAGVTLTLPAGAAASAPKIASSTSTASAKGSTAAKPTTVARGKVQ